MNKTDAQIAHLTAELEVIKREHARLMSVPKIAHYLEAHEANERAAELGRQQEAERAAELASRDAKIRARVERAPWSRLRLAPGTYNSVELDLGELGKRYRAPGTVVFTDRDAEIDTLIARDHKVRGELACGELVREPVTTDEAIRLEATRYWGAR